eukprot:CAMPEP_0182422692 /NCGR_PEP_ID=MMETSP1167-20130531/8449_1 /TAXON_ID=2988 /ORGANISM="Mallomonas Sp, Strain CCMP3275" /LENGTH=781 /DNA_ID=CAMNT_0024600975 /DNA_START=504 /DNA_END=2846 /DNA_ORIENTATION=+
MSSFREMEAKQEELPPEPEGLQKLALEKGLKKSTAYKISMIPEAKAKAVASEDFKLAKQLKGIEGELKVFHSQLEALEVEKKKAVEDEDYDAAADLKVKSDEICTEIEKKLEEVTLPNVSAYQAPPSIRKPVVDPYPAYADNKPSYPDSKPSYPPPIAAPSYPYAPPDSYDDSTPRDKWGDPIGDSSPRDKWGESPRNVGAGKPPPGPSFNSRVPEDSPRPDALKKPAGGGRVGAISPAEHDEVPVAATRMGGEVKDPSEIYRAASRNAGPMDMPPGMEPKSPPRKHIPNKAEVKAQIRDQLEGVEGLDDLPAPDELPSKKRELCDNTGIIDLLGPFLTSCLYSKSWQLRAAALKKIVLRLPEFSKNPGMSRALEALATVNRELFEDKIAQVIEENVITLEAVLKAVAKDKKAKTVASHHFEKVAKILIEKLADGNARVRDAGAAGLEALLSCPAAGPKAIAEPIQEPVAARLKSNWRYVLGRTELLAKMLPVHGVGNASNLSTDRIITFMKSGGAYGHSNGDVRDAAKKLAVEVSKIVGVDAMQGYLKKDLRPKQLEEYMSAFVAAAEELAMEKKSKKKGKKPVAVEESDEEEPEPSPPKKSKVKSKGTEAESKPSPRGKKGATEQSPRGRGKASIEEEESDEEPPPPRTKGKKSAPPAPEPPPSTDDAGDDNFSVCMFCSKSDPTWNEDALDLHYLKDCPLLLECPACAQVIEITGFPEHMLDECDHKDTFVPCETTGLAVLAKDFAAWEKSDMCKAPPDGSMCCPLCFKAVADSDESW